MGGEQLGDIVEDRAGKVRLLYADAYAGTPLSVSMPLAARRHPDRVVGAWLDNLLPDNAEVRRRWRAEFHVGDLRAFSLLRHVGEEVAGGAQFVRPERVADVAAGGELIPQKDTDIAERLRKLRRDPTSWEAALDHGRFSLAGSQAKFALHRDKCGWAIPTGRLPTTHILKPAMRGFADQDIGEHVCMTAAARMGLTVAESQVLTFDDERAFVATRYDRLEMPDGWLRVHQEDMCQALAVPSIHKYEDSGGPTAVQVVQLLKQFSSAPAADVDRFVAALAWNWLAVGTDAHGKNYSLLLLGRDVRLAPLYDLNSLLPYRAFRAQKMAMRVGAATGIRSTGRDQWATFAKHARLPEDRMIATIAGVLDSAADAFADAARAADIADLDSDVPSVLVDRVARRVATCRGQIKSAGA